ncbi:MAG: hypothetical protein WAX80_02140 [Minisyncoccia bacterium]
MNLALMWFAGIVLIAIGIAIWIETEYEKTSVVVFMIGVILLAIPMMILPISP